MTTARDIENTLLMLADENQRRNLMRFFKTGEGDYGEGDEFLGIRVPQTRMVVKEAKGSVPDSEIVELLHSRWHEARLAGWLLLVAEMEKVLPKKSDYAPSRSQRTSPTIPAQKALRRKAIAELYLKHATQANNWDLVDLSCPRILGNYLLHDCNGDFSILSHLAVSNNLWEQRIALVTNWLLIRNGIFSPLLTIAPTLLSHPHDLIHKAIGWMLRELGKKDKSLLTDFLESYWKEMPRTTLRYAIEQFPESERLYWLHRS